MHHVVHFLFLWKNLEMSQRKKGILHLMQRFQILVQRKKIFYDTCRWFEESHWKGLFIFICIVRITFSQHSMTILNCQTFWKKKNRLFSYWYIVLVFLASNCTIFIWCLNCIDFLIKQMSLNQNSINTTAVAYQTLSNWNAKYLNWLNFLYCCCNV